MQHLTNTAQTISVFVQNKQTTNYNFKDKGPQSDMLKIGVKVKQVNTVYVEKLLK